MRSPSPRRARIGASLMFVTNGALLSALLPRYPEIKADLDLSNAFFGLVVISFPLGAILAAGLAGPVIRRIGAPTTTVVGSVVVALGMALAGVNGAWPLLVAPLLLAGFADSITDAAQNVHGLRVERWGGRSIINSLHAIWSLGAALGGAIGAACAAAEVPIGLQMAVNGVVWSAVAVLAARLAAVPDGVGVVARDAAPVAEASPPPPRTRGRIGWTSWRLLLPLVVLAICGTLVEEVANSWVVLYLRTSTDAPFAVAGLGLTVVLVGQLVGRLLGDPMTDRWGREHVARLGGLLVALGIVVAMSSPVYPGTLVGLAVMGFGSATLVPAAFAAADEVEGLPSGTGVALLGWLMRAGFLLTSPVVGVVSQVTSLRTALLVVAVPAGVLAAAVAHRRLRGPRTRRVTAGD